MNNILYIECRMGVAGDMLSAALLEICPDRERVLDELNGMGLPGVTFRLTESTKCGITGSHLTVLVDGDEEESIDHNGQEHGHHHDHDETHHHDHHPHRSMEDIEHIISLLTVPARVREDAINVYKRIADAESRVHGKSVSEIHFHEVGSMDAIADITAACLLMSKIGADMVCASPVNTGSGEVRCSHGILPVPAPATALLLEGIPSYSSDIRGELTTPTGAALLGYFAQSFGPQPVMRVRSTGYGMGKKDFTQANCVRVMLGEAADAGLHEEGIPGASPDPKHLSDTVTELVCNLDDMTPEEIGFATERLLEEGALDVFTTPVYMKKMRPAVMLTVLCREKDRDAIIRSIFRYTTTIGIRESILRRYILDRSEDVLHTPDGDIRVKRVEGYGIQREKPEYDDLSGIARKKGISIRDVREMI